MTKTQKLQKQIEQQRQALNVMEQQLQEALSQQEPITVTLPAPVKKDGRQNWTLAVVPSRDAAVLNLAKLYNEQGRRTTAKVIGQIMDLAPSVVIGILQDNNASNLLSRVVTKTAPTQA